MSELPEPWRTAAEQAGVRQTYRGIGEAAGLSHVTVRRLIAQGRTSPATIGAVAVALGVEESAVYQWAGVPVSDWGPWIPPREAHKLNPRAREALDELIRAITEDGGSHGLVDSAQKSTEAAVTPAEGPPVDYAWSSEPEVVMPTDDEPLPVTSPDDVALAARRTRSDGRRLRAEADARGEESQDDGGMDPV